MKAEGRIDDAVYVDEVGPANRIYNKGFTGTPQPGNTLKLSFIEAAYAQQEGRLWTPLSFAELIKRAGPNAEVEYLVYRDLRERGLVTRHAQTGFTVWNRSENPKQKPWFHCTPYDERNPLDPESLQPGVLSVADSDGVVTHYWVEASEPSGTNPTPRKPEGTATRLENRVLLEGSCDLGTPVGDHTVLSLVEAAYLDIEANAPHLDVFQQLTEAGVCTKSGFRFGTHFRGYEQQPEKCHARWLIQCPEGNMDWSDISRAVRLAHGVKKEYLIAHNGYWHLNWFRP